MTNATFDERPSSGVPLASQPEPTPSVVEKLQSRTEDVRHAVAARVDAIVENTLGAAARAREAVAQTTDEVGGHIRGFGDDLEGSIDRNPLIAVLIAIGVGVAVGLLGSARR